MKIERDNERKQIYIRMSNSRISYTLQIEDGVFADYDEGGGVVGVELIGQKSDSSEDFFESLILKARSCSKGPKKIEKRTIE